MSLRDQVDDYLVPNKSEGLQSQDLRTELLLVGPLASYLARALANSFRISSELGTVYAATSTS